MVLLPTLAMVSLMILERMIASSLSRMPSLRSRVILLIPLSSPLPLLLFLSSLPGGLLRGLLPLLPFRLLPVGVEKLLLRTAICRRGLPGAVGTVVRVGARRTDVFRGAERDGAGRRDGCAAPTRADLVGEGDAARGAGGGMMG